MRTYTPKPGEVTRAWHVIDASDVVLGRLASQVAILLRGKHKPQFAPHVDTGDFVIVINAANVVMTGNKAETKFAYRHSGYPGGLRRRPTRELLRKRPERVVEQAVKGMLPKNTPGPEDALQAQGVRGPRPPARGAAAAPRSRSPRSRSKGLHRDRPQIAAHDHRGTTARASTSASAPAAAGRPRSRRSAAARRRSCASAWFRGPASSPSTAARSRSTSRTRCTSS